LALILHTQNALWLPNNCIEPFIFQIGHKGPETPSPPTLSPLNSPVTRKRWEELWAWSLFSLVCVSVPSRRLSDLLMVLAWDLVNWHIAAEICTRECISKMRIYLTNADVSRGCDAVRSDAMLSRDWISVFLVLSVFGLRYVCYSDSPIFRCPFGSPYSPLSSCFCCSWRANNFCFCGTASKQKHKETESK